MPSNKPRVVSYLNQAEKDAFDKFCDKNDYSNSEGVSHLIEKQLIEKSGMTATWRKIDKQDERLTVLEDALSIELALKQQTAVKTEMLAKYLTDFERKIDKLQKQLDESTPDYFLDEEIAAVTGRREQEVYEWRMGLRKPRGERVLRKLKPYEVKDGRWVKKRVGA